MPSWTVVGAAVLSVALALAAARLAPTCQDFRGESVRVGTVMRLAGC